MSVKRIYSRVKRYALSCNNRFKATGKVKYFCVGANKTGTTSLKVAFQDLGYPVGDQRKAEVLSGRYYFEDDLSPIVKFCKTAQVFQDVPFSYPLTYRYLDEAYPGSKFILTMRDSSEQWYQSITRFHAKLFGTDGQIPTADDLKRARYVWPGYMYNLIKLYGTSEEDPYNKNILIAHYEKHNRDVITYFKDRPSDLLVLNLSEQGAYQKFVNFLSVDSTLEDFPWENRT